MHPKLIQFNTPEFLRWLLPDQITIHSYGFFIALGILVGFIITLRMTRKYGLDQDKLSNLFFWTIIAAFVGGKLFFFMEDLPRYMEDPRSMLRLSGGGFVFYGSLIFAVPVIVFWLRKHKVPVRPFLDVLAVVGPVVHSFGRIGCLMAGCCHGKVCHTWVGITFNHPDTLADPAHTALYPTQLFDIAVNLIILLVVLLLRKRKRFDGQLFLVYLMLYAIGRSIVEIYRGDEERGFVFDGLLSHSQFIAIIVVVISSYFWYRWTRSSARKDA